MEIRIDRFKLGEGELPASFMLLDLVQKTDTRVSDFGESAIGSVAPADFGFWWIILLLDYTKSTGDLSLAETPECRKGKRLILTLCLRDMINFLPCYMLMDAQ